MSTKPLLDKLQVLRQVINKAEHSYLHEFAAVDFNILLDESRQYLGDKAGHIEKIKVPNVSALQSEKVGKPEIISKANALIKALKALET